MFTTILETAPFLLAAMLGIGLLLGILLGIGIQWMWTRVRTKSVDTADHSYGSIL